MSWQPIEDLPDGSFRFIGWIHHDARNSNDQAYVEYERIGKEYRRIDDGRPCGEPKFFTLLTPPNKGAIMLTDQNDCHSRFRGVGRLYIEDGRLYYGMGGDTRMLETTKETILECLRNRPQGENDQTFAERVVAIIQVKNLPAGKIRIHSEGVEDND